MRPTRRQLLRIPLHSFSTENTLLVCLFNARSVGTSRRRSDISTFILDNNINIMLLTLMRPRSRTWLCLDTPSSPSLALRADPASKVGLGNHLCLEGLSQAACIVYLIFFFSVQHPCFEAAQLTLTYNKQLTNFFCIYRPPPSKKNNFTDSMFFQSIF